MQAFDFEHLLACLGSLSVEQRHQLGQALQGVEKAESATERLEAHFVEAPKYPALCA